MEWSRCELLVVLMQDASFFFSPTVDEERRLNLRARQL